MNCFFDRDFYSTPISIRFGQENLITVDFGDFQMLLDQDDWSVSRHIALTKSYEPWLTSFIRENVKTGMTAIDVGANIGFHSMLLAGIVGPHGKVVSFEPNSENCRLVLLNAEKNQFKNIELLPLALSEIRGFALFRTAIGITAACNRRRPIRCWITNASSCRASGWTRCCTISPFTSLKRISKARNIGRFAVPKPSFESSARS